MDVTSLWAFVQRHKDQLVAIPFGLLIFVAGWQAGRITSPYYAAHPIIFEEQSCEESCVTSGGTKEELQALQDQGSALADQKKTTPNLPTGENSAPTGTIAGTTTTEQGKFVGSVNSNLYHALDCPSVSRIKEENKVWFATVEEAQGAGYSPSKCTEEKLGS